MAESLPQLAGDRLFIGDGGLETTLIFHQGLELPDFAAFPLLDDDAGRAALRAYFEPTWRSPREHGAGVRARHRRPGAPTPTGARGSATTRDALDAAQPRRRRAASAELARRGAAPTPVVVNGVLGPRGDGYVAGERMTAEEAESYHARQIGDVRRGRRRHGRPRSP